MTRQTKERNNSASFRKRYSKFYLTVVIFSLLSALQAGAEEKNNYMSLSLDDLMGVELTSAGKKSQELREVSSAVYVLTEEDIKRSPAQSVPELLRLVPGVEVAQIDSTHWAISIRGFNGFFSNKLLVLIDGRPVYSPLFSGTLWDQHAPILQNIKRIEVIRGPGGSLWGANAFSGVINIIRKSSSETQGGWAELQAGTERELVSKVRYGGQIGDAVKYRFAAKREAFGSTEGASPMFSGNDNWQRYWIENRFDYQTAKGDELTFQSDLVFSDPKLNYIVPSPDSPYVTALSDRGDVRGGNALARWRHDTSETESSQVQVYYDRSERDEVILDHTEETYSFDFEHRTELFGEFDTVFGLGYRTIDSTTVDSPQIMFGDKRRIDLASGFVSTEFPIFDDTMTMTLGSKFEHNDYTGFEIQPTLRLLAPVGNDSVLWGGVSRAIRTPSRVEADLMSVAQIFEVAPGNVQGAQIVGNSKYHPEELLSFEMGARSRVSRTVSFDIATFFNHVDRLNTFEPVGMVPASYLGRELAAMNLQSPMNEAEANVYGGEVVLDYQPISRWKLQAVYSLQKTDIEANNSRDITVGQIGRRNPENLFHIRSYFDVSDAVRFDGVLRYVDNLSERQIGSYEELDLKLTWEVNESTELFLIGNNLLAPSHQEYVSESINFYPRRIERGMVVGVSVEF